MSENHWENQPGTPPDVTPNAARKVTVKGSTSGGRSFIGDRGLAAANAIPL
ncbi:hypothetical protein SAV14893_089860 [Streptomyces avermitilis]|uniref:Uncharacterized protein n=1 Tax=Streptomyces avermitilis TaxID=33903 RepID=A0A4D4MCG7_STRAX|nr:hypothetical protein SAV14893_089860 [Streptomyces avermitilis]